MTNNTRSSDDIERDIAGERAQMSDTINDLQKKFSVDAILSDVGSMFRGQGGDLGRAISDTVGRNPVAVAMVGVGLAWLVLGQSGASDPRDKPRGRGKGMGRHSSGRTSYHRDDVAHTEASARNTDFPRDDSAWYRDDRMAGGNRSGATAGQGWGNNRSGVADATGGLKATIRDAAGSVRHAMSDAAASVGDMASSLTDRLSHGLDDLSDDAKARVVQARRAAHEARQSSEALFDRGSRAASGFFEDQPLVVGALAVALGAALGGALPHSKLEDDTMGDSSDQLYADAQALYRAERDKAMAALRMAGEDAKDEVREMRSDLADLVPEGKSVGEVIVDRTADAATRVFGRATGAVEHETSDKTQG